MASTVKAKTLRVTIQEDIVLNGTNYGSKTKVNIASVNEIYRRTVTCVDDTDCTIAVFKSATNTADGAIDIEDVRYIRVTNLDDTNPVNLSLQIDTAENDSAAADSATILLEAGKSFIMGSPSDGIAVDSTGATIVTALVNLESLLIDPLSETGDVEVFIASV